MIQEEYVINRLIELELENKELKEEIRRLKEQNTVLFLFQDKYMPKNIYKVEFEENGDVKILKENQDEMV